MFARNLMAAAGLALIASSAPAFAQDGELLAPRVERDSGTIDIRLVVSGYGNSTAYDRLLRDAEALVDPKTWITAQSTLYRAHKANPEAWRSGSLDFEVDAQGQITGCQARGFDKMSVEGPQLCKEFSGQRFLPALSREGERIASGYRFYVSKYVVAAEAGSARRTLVDPAPPPPIVIAPPPATGGPRLRLTQFPPYGTWMRAFYREPDVWALAPLRSAESLPADAETVGIVLSSDGTGLTCDVPRGSGDPGLADAACDYATTKLKPRWTEATQQNPRAIPLLAVREGGTIAAYAPVETPRGRAEFVEGSEDQLVTALGNGGVFPDGIEQSRLELSLIGNADGTIQSCRIGRSTGVDALDIDACEIARNVASILPRQDMFGQPQQRNFVFWEAATPEQ